MNKNTHRLIFSAVRGMLVAVRETAVGRGKGRQGGGDRPGQGTTFYPVLWLTVIAASMMGLPGILDLSAQAQTLPIQVDKNAPGARPVVGVAANGVPIVNIAAPNRNGGTSVNNFIQYNVGPSGVVLNNSGQHSQTQSAGWVQGNMQLGNNSAGAIVNQVTAPNPSQLMGMQEVAGNRATVILANPAGISCSGCGVINADRFTLSTGRALYGPDGNLSGFDVRDGHIAIEGQGLSSPQAQVDFLARSISINAELWAKHLNAITGTNRVEYQNLNATAQAGNGAAPQFALDASALGSMYANGAIRLIGTEKGVGFNLGGIADARGGDITVDSNGDVRVLATGRLQSQGNAAIAGTNLDNAGTLTTRGSITATTPAQLTNTGTIAAGSDLLARADRIANAGTLGAGVDANANVTGAGTANIAARTAIQSSGTIVAGGDANLSAPTLDLTNGSIVSHSTANLSASGDIVNRNARVEGAALRVVAGGNVDNQGGALVAGVNGGTIRAVNLLNQGGAITSGGVLDVAASQAVDNTSGAVAGTGATTLAAASTVNWGGTIGSVQDKLIVTGALDNTGGKAMAAGDLKVAGGAITNDRGQISGQTVSLDTPGLGLRNAQGTIQGASSTHIAAGSLQNQDGTVSSGGTLDMQTAGHIDNQRGTIAANGSATVAASQTDNRGGTLGSVNDQLLVTGALDNTGGKALAGTDMTLSGGTIVNDHGQLAAGGNLKANTNGQVLVNTAGVISGGTVQTDTRAFNNQGGVLASKGALQSDTHGQAFDNSAGGHVIAGGPLAMNARALNNKGGTISGQQAVTVNGTALDNTGGKVLAGGPLAVTGDSLANGGGQVASNNDATLRIANTLDNSAGFLHASGALDAQAGTILNRNTLGGTDANPLGLEGGTVKLAATSIDNTRGALRADTVLDATAATLDNTQGEVTSGGTAQLNIAATTNTQGLLAANQKLGLTGASLTGDGKVQSQGDIDLKLTSDLRNTGAVTAGRNLALDTTGDVDNLGTMKAGAALDLHGRNISNAGELYGAVANTIRADRSVTNAGLIDGGAVRIEAGTTVTNVDRIFGDSVAIGAGQQIVNDVNPVTGNGAVIASRSGDVDLGAPDIINREHSLIYVSQDLNVGGALDANGKATGQANSLLNASATIDVVRDARFNVAMVTNRNDHFSTERIDTGTVHSQGYRLNGSDQEFKPEDVILYQLDNGSWAPGTDPGFLGDDDKKVLVLPSAQYPFSQFGPPFDWSRTPDPGVQVGGRQKPIGAAFFPYSYVTDANGNLQMGPEVFVYQPADAIWSKLGVQAPTTAPPLPVACGDTPTSACQAKFDADTATYNAWRDANKPLYEQLNTKINAFNGDFNSRQVKEFFIVNKDTNIQDEKVVTTDPAKILVGRHATFPDEVTRSVTNDKSRILVGGDLMRSCSARASASSAITPTTSSSTSA